MTPDTDAGIDRPPERDAAAYDAWYELAPGGVLATEVAALRPAHRGL